MVLTASLLTLFAAAFPSVARHHPYDVSIACQPEEAAWCTLPTGRLSLDGRGLILRTLEPEEILRHVSSTIKCLKEDISPNYVGLSHVLVAREGRAQAEEAVIVSLPSGMTPAAGDSVDYRGAFTDPKLACHYIPLMATRFERAAGAR